jgi:hypothetical protein
MMYRKAMVPDDFIVPTELTTEKFRLRPLTINDVDKDFEAVQNSVNKEGKLTPRQQLTNEQNLIDLAWHQKEFQSARRLLIRSCHRIKKNVGDVYIFTQVIRMGWRLN